MMKNIILLSFFGILFSCQTQHKAIAQMNEAKLTSDCPTDGKCELKILHNKQLILLYDDLGGMYYDIKDQEGTTVVHYKYNKVNEPNIQDGHYREDVIFEIKNSDKKLTLKDEELQEVKLIFGRHCFCKGQTGYFKIDKGNLNLTSDASFNFTLDFTCDKVPQLIKKVTTE